LAPRTLLRFLATTDPAESLSPSTDFPVSPVIRLPAPPISRRGEEGFSSCLACPCRRAVPITPPKRIAASVSCDDPYCLRPAIGDSTFGFCFSRPPVGSLALRPGDLLTILKMALSIGFRSFSFLPSCYPSRVGGGALARWPPSAAQTARTVLPYAAFTKAHRWWDAREGINPTKLTSPYWLYSAAHGSCFQPLLRQRLHRCDQIRRTIQQSSRWKSFRT
jgi:hypothetical protein